MWLRVTRIAHRLGCMVTTTDPIRALKARRRELAAEVDRLDRAIAVLMETDPAAPKKRGKVKVKKRAASSRSVRSRVKALLEEEPQEWTMATVVDEFNQRSDPIGAKNPRAATRTALASLATSGDAKRIRDGVYIATKYAQEAPGPNREPNLLD